MGKLFGLVLMLGALYVGLTVYAEGIDHAFGGALAGVFDPLESANTRDPYGTHLTPVAQSAGDLPTERRRSGSVTQRVREKVTADLERGAARRGYDR
jgi:hypothetical protein